MKKVVLAATALLAACAAPERAADAKRLDGIEHIVVLYLENRSFDNMFGLFPGASGLGDAVRAAPQVDRNGTVLATLPPVMVNNWRDGSSKVDTRFPTDLPNAPWNIDHYIRHTDHMPDLRHEFYANQIQINGGRNDRFVEASDAGALVMGYHDTRGTHLWRLATEFTLADNFFQAAFGGSFLNHQWLACACTPVFPDAPEDIRAKIDADGRPLKYGQVTPDGFAVNTIEPRLGPHRPTSDPARLVPPQTAPTIGDRLSDKGVTWAWYAGGWADAEGGKPRRDFQYHHQPYAFFARYAPGTPDRAEHIRDDSRFEKDVAAGTLPQVAFVKPTGVDNQHPGYSDVDAGDRYAGRLVERLRNSPYWDRTVIIITYDEFGGLYDHVAPPKGDRWGPGSRIPAIVVGPFAKKGHVDHTPYDTTSVLKTIELRFGLAPLTSRDAAAKPMLGALDF